MCCTNISEHVFHHSKSYTMEKKPTLQSGETIDRSVQSFARIRLSFNQNRLVIKTRMVEGLCTLHHSLFLTRSEASAYPSSVDIIPSSLVRLWSEAQKCLLNEHPVSRPFGSCIIVGGAKHRRSLPTRKFDATFRVGLQSRTRGVRSSTLVNIQWLSELLHKPADMNILVMGSVHSNSMTACRAKSLLTNPRLKEMDRFFANYTHKPLRAKSMRTMQPIYNPSLGFFAIVIGMQLCHSVQLFAYDLDIMDPDAPYRGRSRVKDHQHDFIMERQVIGPLLRRCNHTAFAEYLPHTRSGREE